jgi:hypothetical protein
VSASVYIQFLPAGFDLEDAKMIVVPPIELPNLASTLVMRTYQSMLEVMAINGVG